jgi:hypothetical protein
LEEDGGDLGDGEHPAEEEPGEDVVVVSVLAEPHLDLSTMGRNEMNPNGRDRRIRPLAGLTRRRRRRTLTKSYLEEALREGSLAAEEPPSLPPLARSGGDGSGSPEPEAEAAPVWSCIGVGADVRVRMLRLGLASSSPRTRTRVFRRWIVRFFFFALHKNRP